MNSTALSTLFLYLDIETIPSQDPTIRAEIDAKHAVAPLDLSGVRPDGRLKNPLTMVQGKKETEEEFQASRVAAQDAIDKDLEAKRAKVILDHGNAVEKAAAAAEEEYRKTALDGTTGHIACASFALNDDEIINVSNAALGMFSKPHVAVSPSGNPVVGQTITIRPGFLMVLDDERKMLEALFAVIENSLMEIVLDLLSEKWTAGNGDCAGAMDMTERAMAKAEFFKDKVPLFMARAIPALVAHYAPFDVRFVWQRAIVLGVKVPDWWPLNERPWAFDRVQDTMTMWAGTTGRIGLDRLCRALGIEGKGDIDGSKVWDAVQAGRINDVCRYCDDDVERLRRVHGRITGRVRVIERGSRATDPVEPMPDDLPDYLPGGDDHATRERGTSPHLSER